MRVVLVVCVYVLSADVVHISCQVSALQDKQQQQQQSGVTGGCVSREVCVLGVLLERGVLSPAQVNAATEVSVK